MRASWAGVENTRINNLLLEEEEPTTIINTEPERNIVDANQHLNINPDYPSHGTTSLYRAPARLSAVPSSSLNGRLSSSAGSSGMFALPEREPEDPFSFKAALEFLPKNFDGENMPVSRFISDCLFARDSIVARDRRYISFL